MTAPTTRRTVLVGTCGAACATALAGCSTYNTGGPAVAAVPPPAAPSPTPGAAAPVAATADVPVGGGTVLLDQGLVLTQPAAGEFQAFSATCTHQGCAVREVTDGVIVCPCHGSRFAIEDGSVVKGPASRPLERRTIEVQGDSIVLA